MLAGKDRQTAQLPPAFVRELFVEGADNDQREADLEEGQATG